MDRKPSAFEMAVRRTLARQSMIVGFFTAYCIAFPFFLFSGILRGDGDAVMWASAIAGILAWWFAKDADKGLPIESFLKKGPREAEPKQLDTELPLASSVIFRVITSKLAIPIGIALAVGTSMLFWEFEGNIRRRGGFYRALVSVFGQEGTAILLGLVIGGLVFWWLNSLDEEILDEQRDREKKLMNFGYLSGANYNKFILTSILVVLVVIAFLLASG